MEAETPQDLSQSGYRPAARLLPRASDVRDRGFRGRRSLHNLPRSPIPPQQPRTVQPHARARAAAQRSSSSTTPSRSATPSRQVVRGQGWCRRGHSPGYGFKVLSKARPAVNTAPPGTGLPENPSRPQPAPTWGGRKAFRGPKVASTPNPPWPFPSPIPAVTPGECAWSWSPAPQPDTPPCAAGTVLAWRVVEYLQAVTGQSSEEGQLRALHRMLDPEAAGAALDLPTFHAIMREWIASCQQEGSVPGDQGQKAVPHVPAGTTDSSHLSRGPRFAEEWDVAAGDLGLVLAGGCQRRKGPRGGRGGIGARWGGIAKATVGTPASTLPPRVLSRPPPPRQGTSAAARPAAVSSFLPAGESSQVGTQAVPIMVFAEAHGRWLTGTASAGANNFET